MANLKLMQGNWVNTPDGAKQIQNFVESAIHVGYGKFYGYTQLSGIPLTPQILEKCPQIVWKKDRWRFEKFSYCSNIEIPNVIWIYYDGKLLRTAEYLHTLQQLVSLLCNTELIVNL